MWVGTDESPGCQPWHLQRPSSCLHCVNNGEITSVALFLKIPPTSDVPPSSIMSFLCKPHRSNWEPKNYTVFSFLSFAFSAWFSGYQGVSLGFSCRLDINSRFTRKLSKFSKQERLFIPSVF